MGADHVQGVSKTWCALDEGSTKTVAVGSLEGGLFFFQFLVLVVYFVMDAKYFGLYLFIDINLANKTVNKVKILSDCVYCI